MDVEALTSSASDDFLQSLVPGIQQQLEQGETHERELSEQLNEQRQLNGRLRSILRAVDPNLVPVRQDAIAAPEPARSRQKSRQRKPATKSGLSHIGRKRRNGTATGYGLTMEAAIPFAEVAKRMMAEQGYVTQKDVYKELDKEQGTCSSAFLWFLAIGFMRRVGRIDRRDKFVIVNPDAPYEALRNVEGA